MSKAPQTMKGVAPAPSELVPSIRMEEDAEQARTGRISIGEDPDEQTQRAVDIGEVGLADAEAALEAMSHFQEAEEALQRGDLAGAELSARRANQGDPSEANYKTLLAWVRAQSGTTQAVDEAIRVMSKVLIEDSNERALFYRAKLLIRKNRLHEAMHDFDELLSSNPDHAEASREAKELRAKLPPI